MKWAGAGADADAIVPDARHDARAHQRVHLVEARGALRLAGCGDLLVPVNLVHDAVLGMVLCPVEVDAKDSQTLADVSDNKLVSGKVAELGTRAAVAELDKLLERFAEQELLLVDFGNSFGGADLEPLDVDAAIALNACKCKQCALELVGGSRGRDDKRLKAKAGFLK